MNECLYDAIVCFFFVLFFEPQLHGSLDVCTYFSFSLFFFLLFFSLLFFLPLPVVHQAFFIGSFFYVCV